MAEGHAAVHASGALLAQAFLGHVLVELAPVVDPVHGRHVHGQLPGDLHEALGFGDAQRDGFQAVR